jgi:predicted nucleic acid-binding protein
LIVVSDTSPILNLSVVDGMDILRKLSGGILADLLLIEVRRSFRSAGGSKAERRYP